MVNCWHIVEYFPPSLCMPKCLSVAFLFQKAIEIIISGNKASTSYLQRRLGIGYNKAANIIEKMENDGIVSAADSYGRREILLNEQNFDNI